MRSTSLNLLQGLVKVCYFYPQSILFFRVISWCSALSGFLWFSLSSAVAVIVFKYLRKCTENSEKLLCLCCLVPLSSPRFFQFTSNLDNSDSGACWFTPSSEFEGSLSSFFRLLTSSLCPPRMLSAHCEIFNFDRLDLICHSCEIKEKKREQERKKRKKTLAPNSDLCSMSPSSFDFDCV